MQPPEPSIGSTRTAARSRPCSSISDVIPRGRDGATTNGYGAFHGATPVEKRGHPVIAAVEDEHLHDRPVNCRAAVIAISSPRFPSW
jgi:hypothetical protein